MNSTSGFLDVQAAEVFIHIVAKNGMEMKYRIPNPRQVGLGFNYEVETGDHGYSMTYGMSSKRELDLKISY